MHLPPRVSALLKNTLPGFVEIEILKLCAVNVLMFYCPIFVCILGKNVCVYLFKALDVSQHNRQLSQVTEIT